MVDFVRNIGLKFTPLEFETHSKRTERLTLIGLKFTPLEFETSKLKKAYVLYTFVKIYSVGV